MRAVVRGATVHFDAAFFGADGLPAQPAVVQIEINFQQAGARKNVAANMIFDLFTASFVYDWGSGVSDPCTVAWSINSDPSMVPIYANEGTFELDANAANLGD